MDRFKADLEARGHHVWIDYKEIGSWDDWKGAITRGIHDSQLAIAFLSIHSTRDPGVCRNEVAMALQHFGKVYPVLVEEIPRESIPVTIAHLQWPDLSRWQEYRDQEDLDFERFYEEKFLEIVSRIEGEAGRFASEAEVLRCALNPSGFEGRFARYLDGFTGREWVFDAYEHWLDQQPSSRVFWVKAGPGFGKTALAVQMANRHRAAIVGTWFCDHQSVELRDPLRALQTIAYQLALRWDDYRVRLLPRLGLFADSAPERIEEARKELAKKNLNDLFSFLISEPMAGLIWREHKLVILVDALDEATEPDGTNPLASLISGRFLELPEWIGFVVTSRPDASVVPYLQGFKPFAIEAGDDRNTADLQSYCSAQIGPMLPAPDRERLCKLLVEKSEGMMLFLRLVLEGLREGTLQPSGLDSMESGLPGLHSRYHAAFEARFRKDFQENVQPLLRLVMAAPGSMPLDLAREVLGWDRELAVRTRAMIGSYLVEDGGGLSLFHKTLGEWLASEGAGIYFTDPLPAGKALGEYLWESFDQRETDENDLTRPLSWEKQVIDWLPKLLNLTDRRENWDKVGELGSWLTTKYEWNISEMLYRNLIHEMEYSLGPQHPDTLKIKQTLGFFLDVFKEHYCEAELLYRQVIKDMEKILGSKHPDTLNSIERLADLALRKGDLAEAESIYRKIMVIREKTLGLEHPDSLSIANSLGDLLFQKGDITEAENLYRRIFENCQKKLGDFHVNSLLSMSILACFLEKKGDIEEGEVFFRQSLKVSEKLFGLDHPETIENVCNLGRFLLLNKEDLVEAENLIRRAVMGHEKFLGKDDITTMESTFILSELLVRKGFYSEAEVLRRRVLEFNQKTFGDNFSLTLIAAFTLGILLYDKGNYEEAEELLSRVINGYEKLSTISYDLAFESINILAYINKVNGNIAEAEFLYRRGLVEREKVLGSEHLDTLDSAIDLGNFLLEKGDIDDAETFYRIAYEGKQKSIGSSHQDTLNIAFDLGTLLNSKGDYDGAEALYRRALEGREKALGAEHLETIASAYSLASVINRGNRRPEAISLLRRFASFSAASRDAVAYNFACYECLEGNHEEAKRLISEHLKLHPEKKEQALADEDFAAIRDWISELDV